MKFIFDHKLSRISQIDCEKKYEKNTKIMKKDFKVNFDNDNCPLVIDENKRHINLYNHQMNSKVVGSPSFNINFDFSTLQ